MKKQYKAPSIEIELHGISNFCAGCNYMATTFYPEQWQTFSAGETCFQIWYAMIDIADYCHNSPNDTTVPSDVTITFS